MKLILSPLILAFALTACGDNKSRFLIAPVAKQTEQRVSVASIEVRDVSLPAYAAASEMMVEGADGALRPVKKALWADDPMRGITGMLARTLDLRSTAAAAAEPWPLADPAQVQLEVRIDEMVARADGNFGLTGQFALSSAMGATRDRLQRFDIKVPMGDSSPATVATATGAAIEALADEVLAQLKR